MYPNQNNCPECSMHTNAFIDLNGMPYLLAEYLDRRNFQTLDRAMVYSAIDVDTSETMRAVVDVKIDDIGKSPGGDLNIVGNNSKQRALIESIYRNYQRLDHNLPVIKKGIRVTVNFSIQNQRTGHTIRSAQENIFIDDRMYYIDVNSRDMNDNAIVCNFSQSCVSSLTEFTHGRDPMVLRINSIQLSYAVVSPEPVPPTPESLVSCPNNVVPPVRAPYENMYNYHNRMQNHHYIGDYGCQPPEAITPPQWSLFNRLYHFDNAGKDITLHHGEIYDVRNRVVNVPCGQITVNRAFRINPGHRIIWKFSIWKNDVTSVTDTTSIAAALKAPYYPEYPCYPNGGYPAYPGMDPNVAMRMYHQSVAADYEQNAVINQLAETVNELTVAVNELKNASGSTDTPIDVPNMDNLPEKPCRPIPPHPPCPPRPPIPKPIRDLIDRVEDLEQEVDNITDDMVTEDEIGTITPDEIGDIVDDAIENVPDIDDTPTDDNTSSDDIVVEGGGESMGEE